MSKLYDVIGTASYKNLLADPVGADAIGIPCEPGNGAIPCGMIMYRTSDGLYKPASTSEITTSYYLVVLAEDVDTGEAIEPGSVAEEAKAYRCGNFIDGAVLLASNATITEAHKVVLKLNGIVFDKKAGADAFENGTVTITYVANNSVTPAEDDVVVAAMKGSTYTIAANTDTKFTAPATTSFSKWNTKADGTGTNYNAAASYTASADLTLYAVWA